MKKRQEVIVSGYCRAWNQCRTVICEYQDGEIGMEMETDCDYPPCVHGGSCEMIKRAWQAGPEE